MIVCILAKNEDVETIRETAKNAGISFGNDKILNFPVSATGELPVTHWFCSFDASEETYKKLMEIKHLSEIEINRTKTFLTERRLKIIRK